MLDSVPLSPEHFVPMHERRSRVRSNDRIGSGVTDSVKARLLVGAYAHVDVRNELIGIDELSTAGAGSIDIYVMKAGRVGAERTIDK